MLYGADFVPLFLNRSLPNSNDRWAKNVPGIRFVLATRLFTRLALERRGAMTWEFRQDRSKFWSKEVGDQGVVKSLWTNSFQMKLAIIWLQFQPHPSLINLYSGNFGFARLMNADWQLPGRQLMVPIWRRGPNPICQAHSTASYIDRSSFETNTV